MIMDIGRVCKTVKGRDMGKYCVVVDAIDKKSDSNLVLIDGKDIRRRKVNIMHLEPLPLILDISKGDDTAKVIKALETEKLC